MEPAGTGKYERWDLELVDPDFTAPDFKVRFPKEKKNFDAQLEEAARASGVTLDEGENATDETPSDFPNPEEDSEGFLTHTNKRLRSSPGASNNRKKQKSDISTKDFYRNILKSNGLTNILKQI